jgi:hypothetical protein
MDSADRTTRNADELGRRLAARRAELSAASDVPSSHADAVEQMDAYVTLLRKAGPTTAALRRRMMLKVELDDGRWDVLEEEMLELPSVGDDVLLSDGRMSRVREILTVAAGARSKPPWQFVVCTLCGT